MLTEQTDKRTLWWVYGCSALFLAVNAYCMSQEFYWLNIIPAVLLIGAMAIFSLDKLLLFCVFLTPLSINLADNEIHIGLSLPVEPILIGILLLVGMRILYNGKFDRDFIRHPLTIAIFFNLLWMLVTCVTSELPLVSFKYLVSRLWFVVPFYFLGSALFADFKNVKRFMWLYILPLTAVIGFTLYVHSLYGFDEDSAHWVMSPFYNDHTAYGAALAMFYPALFALAWNKSYNNNIRIIVFLLLFIFTVALIFSFTRAAWVSLVGALLLQIVLWLRIQFRTLALLGLLGGIFLYASWGDIMMKLEKNRQDTSDDLAKHIESISNISTDASNLERLNRWNSAFRMFEQRPVFGWGPGTYSFLYAPFQLSSEKTIISTNAGDLGNAHSEYIGPLCESGVLGSLSFLTIVICIMWTGWRLYYKLPPGEERAILMAAFLGLVTYFIHGGLNNFLDTDKASIPFWGFAAMLVAADVRINRKNKAALEEKTKITE